LRRLALLPAAALVLSWTAIFIRFAAAEGVPSLLIATNRTMLAAAILGAYTLLFKRKSIAGMRWRTFRSAILAGVFFGLHLYAFVLAVQSSTVANATLLVATIPIFAAGLGRLFFRERSRPVSYLAIALTMVGSGLIVWGDVRWETAHLKGDLVAIACAILGAMYFLMRRLVPPDQRVGFFPYVLTMNVAAWLVLLTIVIATSQSGQLFAATPRAWFWLFMLAFCCSAIGHSLYNKALDFFKAHVVGSWFLTEPFIATALAWLLLGEAMSWRVLWCVAPTYAGVLWVLWLERDG